MTSNFKSPPAKDTLRIMVATDNHLGFLTSDPVRGEDSFDTMDEILQTARDCHCDCVFLSGDLFHHNKPSRRTMFRTQQVFKKHVFGDNPVTIQVASDQHSNFGGRSVNYEDPSLSVHLPVFIIHGNHDDPTREGQTEPLSAIDILAEAGLVNYFGRADRADDIKIRPVMILKNEVKIALYGLGWVRDERLHRAFLDKKVTFTKVDDEHDSDKSWYNIMLIHQNRAQKGRGDKNCVAESMIPEFMDFVIWGHEHECQIRPEQKGTFFLSQPGSSIAVSLVDGESHPKHVGILEVKAANGDIKSRMVPIPLQTVRPFLIDTSIELSEEPFFEGTMAEADKQQAVFNFLSERATTMIDTHMEKIRKESKNGGGESASWRRKSMPLVRLKVEHTGFPTINLQRFGVQFTERVANPGEMLSFWRKKKLHSIGARKGTLEDNDELDGGGGEDYDEDDVNDTPQERIQRLAEQIMRDSAQKLELFTDQKLHLAVEEFVVKESNAAIKEAVDETLENINKRLKKERARTSGQLMELNNEDAIARAVTVAVEQDKRQVETDMSKSEPVLRLEANRPQVHSKKTRTVKGDDDIMTEDDDVLTSDEDFSSKAKPGANTAKLKASKKLVASKKRSQEKAHSSDEIEEEEEHTEDDEPPIKKRKVVAPVSRSKPRKGTRE